MMKFIDKIRMIKLLYQNPVKNKMLNNFLIYIILIKNFGISGNNI